MYVGKKEEVEKEEREHIENILDYFLETIDHYYDFSDLEDIEEGITKFIKEKKIDLLAMVSRSHNDYPGSYKTKFSERNGSAYTNTNAHYP